jgi:hypothetical protein
MNVDYSLPILDKEQLKEYEDSIPDSQKQFVVFMNGRVERHQRRGHWLKGYRGLYGDEIIFKTLPLCEKTTDGLRVKKKPNPEGQPSIAMYGKHIDFSRDHRIQLNPITHYLVIKHLRNHSHTTSSQKGEGYQHISNGRIIEFEPGVAEALENREAVKAIEAMALVTKITQNQMLKELFAGYHNIHSTNAKLLTTLAGWAQKKPNKIIMAFQQDKNGEYAANPKLTDQAYEAGLMRVAFDNELLTRKQGLIYYDDAMIASNSKELFVKNPELMKDLEAKIEVLIKGEPKSKKNDKVQPDGKGED